jgi:arylsulfatase A
MLTIICSRWRLSAALVFSLGVAATAGADSLVVPDAAVAPNIIVILADDLGYGDLSSFGAQGIKTPHIDQLAADGLRFTQFYSASPVCTPSRAGLLTGRYPARLGIRHVFFFDAHDGMPQSEITIPEQLKQAGYHTGMVGKWHLGHLDRYMPWNQGFDEFYGVPFSNDMANFFFYENQEIIHQPIDQRYLTHRYTQKALDYIERHAGQPFFLYLAHSMPHVPLYVSPEFEGKSELGLYGDVIQELDWSTGQVVEKLRELDLLENTLIIFSSDNGPWLAMGDHGGSSGQLRDGKGTTFEGGQRVPTIAHWPAHIAPGRVENSPASLLDLMPTFSAIAGVPLPRNRVIDGEDLSAVFTNQGKRRTRQFYYMSATSTDVIAYRDGDWKIKLPRKGYPKFLDSILKLELYAHDLLLFNLKDDPYEEDNLAQQFPERASQMQRSIADLEKQIEKEGARDLYMRSTSADRKGYGPLIIKAAVMATIFLLLLIAVVYGVYKLIKSRLGRT